MKKARRLTNISRIPSPPVEISIILFYHHFHSFGTAAVEPTVSGFDFSNSIVFHPLKQSMSLHFGV